MFYHTSIIFARFFRSNTSFEQLKTRKSSYRYNNSNCYYNGFWILYLIICFSQKSYAANGEYV